VDEGKIKWDDKVIKYLPNFKMYNEYVTQEFTIRDLLTHRSGLGLGAGDLMIGLTEVILLPLILYKTYSI
jgi:CubicO group peptidase (beta-lactamase class C family)